MILNYLNLKSLTIILIFIFTLGLYSQDKALSEIEEITIKMEDINDAFIAKDTSALAKLLHDDITLGHSNGWLETKPDLLQTLINEGVLYTQIVMMSEPKFHFTSENLITTRRDINVSGVVNDTSFDVKLNVLEVWICEKSDWQLLARQSVNRKE